MSGRKTKKPGKEDAEQLIGYKSSKRKLSRKAESSEDEGNKSTTMCKKKRLPQSEKKRNVKSQRVLKIEETNSEQTETKCIKTKNAGKKPEISSAIQTETKNKKMKNAGKKAQVSCAIQIVEENGDAQLNDMSVTVFDEIKASNVIRPKSRKQEQILDVCDESVKSAGIKTTVFDFEASSFLKCDSVSGSDVSINSFNVETCDESSELASPKKKPKQSFKKYDLSLTEGVSDQNVNDAQNTLLVKPKQKKVNLKARKSPKNIKKQMVKNDFILNKGIKNKKSVKKNTKRRNKNLKSVDDLICVSDVDCYFKSENSDSSESHSTQNSYTSEKDTDYLPFVSERNSASKNKKSGKKKFAVKKKRGKSDVKKNEVEEELVKRTMACLVELVQCSQVFIDKNNKLLPNHILQAQKCLYRKPLISESTFSETHPNVEDLSTLMLPEKYEIQKPNSSNSQFIDSNFVRLSQTLQDYFVAVAKAIFYTERHVFKYTMNDIRQNICISSLSPFFHKLTVEGIKKFFPDRFHLERIFDLINSLIENPYFHDHKEQCMKEIINLLLDYLISHSHTSTQCGKNEWGSADSSTNFLIGVLRKCETFSEEMYNSILLHLEALFQDTSKPFYFYYNALAILIAFGPLAVFQVLSKNFLPFYNHLSNYVKFEGIVENSSQHEALLVYGHLRSAVELLIKHCSNLNYFKRNCFLNFESSSLSDANRNIYEETEKIFRFILSPNLLHCFGDSLSSRLPLLTNCFVDDVPLSDFAVQLEKKFLSFRNTKQLSSEKTKIIDCTENVSQNKSENTTCAVPMTVIKELQSMKYKNLNVKRTVHNKHFNYLQNGSGNLYLFL